MLSDAAVSEGASRLVVGRSLRSISFVFACLSASAHADSCSLKQLASIDLEEPSGGHYLTLPVMISGKAETFGLEIHIAFNSLWRPAVDDLGLPEVPMPRHFSSGLEGNVSHSMVYTDLSVGNVTLKSEQFLVFPHSTYPDATLAGTLGTHALLNFDAELNLAAHKLNLFSQDHCPGNVVYWGAPYATVPITTDPTGTMIYPMTLDGQPVDVMLETVGFQSRMPMSVATRVFGITAQSPSLVPLSDQKQGFFKYPFKALTIGGLTINNPDVAIFVDDPPIPQCNGKSHPDPQHPVWKYRCWGGADLWLQIPEMKRMRLYYAFKEKMLYVTAADAH